MPFRFVRDIILFKEDAKAFLKEKALIAETHNPESVNDTEGATLVLRKEPTHRILIGFLSKSSDQFIQYISPQSLPVKTSLKKPLLIIAFSTGISSALTQALFKFHGEILQSGAIGFFSGFELTLASCAVLNSIVTLVFLNVAIQYYE